MSTIKKPCLCCGYKTIDVRGEFDICPVCFWEDDIFISLENIDSGDAPLIVLSEKLPFEDLLNIPSGANNGLTLNEARKNYQQCAACERAMINHVRSPKDTEKPACISTSLKA